MEFSISIRARTLAFYETLLGVLPPRTVSDRTCFRRIAGWLGAEIEAGRFNDEIFHEVLVFAREATAPDAINPHAVFVSLLKKELGYTPGRTNQNANAKRQN